MLGYFESNDAAAAAKSLQACPTLCHPIDGPPGFSVPEILQARILEWFAISFSSEVVWGLLNNSRKCKKEVQSLGFSEQQFSY